MAERSDIDPDAGGEDPSKRSASGCSSTGGDESDAWRPERRDAGLSISDILPEEERIAAWGGPATTAFDWKRDWLTLVFKLLYISHRHGNSDATFRVERRLPATYPKVVQALVAVLVHHGHRVTILDDTASGISSSIAAAASCRSPSSRTSARSD